MRKLICLCLIILMMCLTGCTYNEDGLPVFGDTVSVSTGENTTKIVYPYGFLNQETKEQSIKYNISGTALFVAIIFSETVIVPLYIFGFSLFEPEK